LGAFFLKHSTSKPMLFNLDISFRYDYSLQESNWEGQLKGDWENIILPHAEKLGAKTIGTIGEF
jgi:hypothetical protein